MADTIVNKNIALVGMPGCYKTTVGKILADSLCRAFYDTDIIYEEIYGVTISDTFKSEGEAVFRDREAAIIADVCKKEGAVIATGGGAVLRPENIAALRGSCVVIELCASVHTIFERVKSDTSRPLLADMRIQTIEQLYKARENLYRSAADYRVETDKKSPAEIAEEIMSEVGSRS
ncbi:MAG: shikimate kinase [Firmicutes bacterium]|nr:shikimate kinase [Bacillota bacterium]